MNSKICIASTKKLKALQAAEDPPEALATLPKLSLEDLKRETSEYPIDLTRDENGSGITVARHELVSTSGIAYVNFGIDVSGVSLEDALLLPIFTRMLTQTGAGEFDMVSLSRQIGIHTGGLGGTLAMNVVSENENSVAVGSGDHMVTKLFMKGKATADKSEELFNLMKLTLTESNLDSQSKVIEMLKMSRSGLESSIQGSGHTYANMRLKSRYDASSYIEEKMSGISSLESVKSLLEAVENDWPTVLKRLENIRSTILDSSTCRDGMLLSLTGDTDVLEQIQPSVDSFLKDMPGNDSNNGGEKLMDFYKEVHPWVVQAREEMEQKNVLKDEGFIVQTQVSYVGKGGRVYEEGEEVSGSSSVVSKFLRTGYLWDYVRVIGGAYGGFCTFSPKTGYFSFLSYRDPNLSKTLDVYDGAADHLLQVADELEQRPELLETAIIGAMGEMDSSLSPDQKGWISLNRWINNESAESRQRFRDEVIGTTPEDFRVFAKRLKALKEPSVAVISSKAAFEAAAKDGKEMNLSEVV